MTNIDRLQILKGDLQMITSANDAYLNSLLEAAEKAIQREGITLVDEPDVNMAVVQYAAYLFRRRAGTDTAMPRFLRWSLNNILMSQKGARDDV